MNSATTPDSIRACVVAAVWDDASHVAQLCATLQRHLPVRVSVRLCTPLIAAPPFPRAMVPLQQADLGTVLIQKRRADSAREQLHRLERALATALPEGHVPEVTRISATVRTLTARFRQRADLLVVPQPLGPFGLLRRLFPRFRTRLAFASQVPTLFCGAPPPWEGVTVVDTGDRASWIARRLVAPLGARLGISVEAMAPNELDRRTEQREGGSRCVVLSLAAMRRILRPTWLSRLLGLRADACLLWP